MSIRLVQDNLTSYPGHRHHLSKQRWPKYIFTKNVLFDCCLVNMTLQGRGSICCAVIWSMIYEQQKHNLKKNVVC